MKQVDVPCGAEQVGAGALVTGSALGSPSPRTVGQKPLQLSTGVFNPVTAPLCLRGQCPESLSGQPWPIVETLPAAWL